MALFRAIWTFFIRTVSFRYRPINPPPIELESLRDPERGTVPEDSTSSLIAAGAKQADRIQQAQKQIAELTDALEQEKQRRRKLEASGALMQDQLGRLNQQLVAAQSDAEALKGYLSTYDDVSAEEIGNFLKDINDRIEEIACENAHQWLENVPQSSGTLIPPPEFLEELTQSLGLPFVKVLQTLSPEDESALFLIQSAWQACIVGQVHAMLAAFSPVSIARQVDPLFQALSTEVRQGESQPVYGRWRALTHRYLRIASGGETEKAAIAKANNGAVRACYLAARVLFRTADFDGQTFMSALTVPLEAVFAKALALAMILHERVVSKDYRPFAPPLENHGRFDTTTMTTSETEPPVGNEVLCTLRLGMISLSKKPEGVAMSDGDFSIFRLAEVFTKHCLEEATHADDA